MNLKVELAVCVFFNQNTDAVQTFCLVDFYSRNSISRAQDVQEL